MKKSILGVMITLLIVLSGCVQKTPEPEAEKDYICKDTPLAEGCYVPSDDLDFISPVADEYTISETFETDRVNQMPRNWLLYRNEEYKTDGVKATIVENGDNRYVELFSDGLKAPMYPQSAPNPTFIFSTKFNLDQDRKGVAYASILLPSDKPTDSISFGVSTGAVNTIQAIIGSDLKVQIKVGGPFFYYSGTADGGDIHSTNITIQKDTWYTFKFEWDASTNVVSASIQQGDQFTALYSGAFHISNRVNALADGAILVPNVFRVTMPRNYTNTYAYIDDVIVERKGA
ncbi:hypothetical protein N7548_07765 [Acholeplasma manati]|uniref:PI-PLC Y-box domain-containing protein n=1 Tax=Paracholeplasma manati TaxID=591373 RepID=A0ABT2YBT2_9MOLU|nr:hypothetical protein [Paracholeplasma manati]MCV2232713.1 hypothetical protein [Paracholeplasma manati]